MRVLFKIDQFFSRVFIGILSLIQKFVNVSQFALARHSFIIFFFLRIQQDLVLSKTEPNLRLLIFLSLIIYFPIVRYFWFVIGELEEINKEGISSYMPTSARQSKVFMKAIKIRFISFLIIAPNIFFLLLDISNLSEIVNLFSSQEVEMVRKILLASKIVGDTSGLFLFASVYFFSIVETNEPIVEITFKIISPEKDSLDEKSEKED